MAIVTQSTSQISPANERMYHQSALLGEWKGNWAGNNQPVGFKVVNIRGSRAQVEYTHNGHTERGFAQITGSLITFGDGRHQGRQEPRAVVLGGRRRQADRDAGETGATGLRQPSYGKLGGYSSDNGKSASFRVLSVNGNEAQVSVTTDGITRQGTGIVYKNVIMFGQSQIATDDGQNGKIIYQVGTRSFMVPVTKYPPADSSSSVDVTA
ncbi:hypothetical protein ABID58_005632 [Bradyrhizobium sp. S3.2.6]